MERTGLLPFKIGTLNRINYPKIISSATNAKTVSVADVSLSYLTVTLKWADDKNNNYAVAR